MWVSTAYTIRVRIEELGGKRGEAPVGKLSNVLVSIK